MSQTYSASDDNGEFKKGSAEMLVLSVLEARPRHGYEIGKLIERESGGALTFSVASLYPLLYRLEERGLLDGRWVEKASQRRKRFYRITPAGKAALARHRRTFDNFVAAVKRVMGAEYA